MEHLNKQQIVLLTLFCAFVASIATGITVVALLDQAPPSVTQTINRVVERTIEKAIPIESNSATNQQAKQIVVPVAQDDMVVNAVENGAKSLVRIYINGNGTKTFAALGLIVKNDGSVLSDRAIVSDNQAFNQTYTATTNDNKNIELRVGNTYPLGFTLLVPVTPSKDTYPAVAFSKKPPRLGQSIISLGGENRNIVEMGIISSLNTVSATADVNATSTKIVSIETNIRSSTVTNGSPIFSVAGEALGMSVSSSGFEKNVFIPASQITTIQF